MDEFGNPLPEKNLKNTNDSDNFNTNEDDDSKVRKLLIEIFLQSWFNRNLTYYIKLII